FLIVMLSGFVSGPASAQYPYYYRPVPVYPAPAWASPRAAALGPWPWNFDFGGGPTVVSGSQGNLTGGSNFEIGGGYNFTPRTGFVLEFAHNWLGVSDAALNQNNAVDGDVNVWSFTVNPIYRFRIGGPIGGYLIGGGGFYERETRYTQPVQVFNGFFTETDFIDVRQS